MSTSKGKQPNFYEVAQFLIEFEELIENINNKDLSKNSRELLAGIFDEWAKHKLKANKDKAFAILLKGFSSYFHERISVNTKRSKK